MGNTIKVTPEAITLAGSDNQKEVTVANEGNDALHVTVTISGGPHSHAISALPSSFDIAANGSARVTIRASGDFRTEDATVTFAGNGASATVSVAGSGKIHTAPPPNIGFGGADPPGDYSPSGDGWGAPDDACFVAGTLVLGVDGPRPIESLVIGDEILTVTDDGHRTGAGTTVCARVEAVHRHDGTYDLVSVEGIAATPVHRWAVVRGDRAGFAPADALLGGGVEVRICSPGSTELRAAPSLAPAPPAGVVFNLTTSAHTYAVAATADGPFYLVHNTKKQNPDPPPINPFKNST
jgi:hypothetical protein